MSALAVAEESIDDDGEGPTGGRSWDEPPVLVALLLVVLGALATGLLVAGGGTPFDESADARFARDMAAHHEQAIEMADLIRYRTDDPDIRILGVDHATIQTAQVWLMRGWLDSWGLDYRSLGSEGHDDIAGMASTEDLDRLRGLRGEDAEELFLRLMIRHHEGALVMVTGVQRDEASRSQGLPLLDLIIPGPRRPVWVLALRATPR